ncbi:MAG TPA: nitrous oxide reductase family maturation protein NosD [Myxococcales bacterium]|nr:nitrous oxide reductase family maturation protein NosD [Myxococcales bacterium]
MDRTPDTAASTTLVTVALLCLGFAWAAPWWVMEARAPQYGQRTLIVQVNPRAVSGDVFEVDNLGHYVGIRKMENFAPLERLLAPIGFAVALAGVIVVPFLRKRWQRAAAALPAIFLPIFFLVDLDITMARAANDRDPDAALNLILSHIDTRLFGEYVVAQFKVTAKPGIGLYLAGIAALLVAGLVFAAPLAFARKRKEAITAAVAAVLLVPATLRAEVLQVGPQDSVAAAVERAHEGDTLRIEGVHRERITVPKRLRLVGVSGAALDGGGEGTVLRIQSSGVEVDGLDVRGSGDLYSREDSAIRIERAEGVALRNLVISDALFGIFAAQADKCLFENLTISGKDFEPERRGDGIRLWYSSGCVLRRNTMEKVRDLVIWYSAGTLVEDNLVRHSRYGLHYMYSDHNVFRRNRFDDNEVGAAIMYSRDITLEQNAFSFASGASADGLLVKDADDVFVRDNRFVQNAIALFLDGAPQSRGGRLEVRGNLIAQNGVGVALQPSTRGAEFSGNAFAGNQIQVQVQGGGSAEANRWEGNWWSDASVYDRDGDGFSDLPYRSESVYEVLADRHPELRVFAGSPAADAIDLGARLFPLFRSRPILEDAHPLVRRPLSGWTAAGGEPSGPGLLLSGAALLGAALAIARGAKAVLS